MEIHSVLDDLGLTGAGYAASVTGGPGVGFNAEDPVSPASVMKIQVALAVERAIASGSLDGSATRVLSPERRTPGPVGVSLMRDEVRMSVRDLVVAMLTISDNVATDELIDLVGLDRINSLTRELGLEQTLITSTLRDALDEVADEAGFATYAALVAHEPDTMGPPSAHDIRTRLHSSAALDPTRGTRTTAAETVGLLQAIWTNQAAPAEACASIRRLMEQQLTRQRIASAFAPPVSVAAKSGGLLGVARNEAAVVTFPDGAALAVAVFTRSQPSLRLEPAVIDTTIGAIARDLIGRLHDL
jgi:beta-lactamase class A